jgi:F0F1-type ATP synthase assembly protein I
VDPWLLQGERIQVVPAGEQRDERGSKEGFGDALAHAAELVGTTMLFVLGGLWLDGRFGTKPLFMLILGTVVIAGLGVIEYYRYQERMNAAEEGKPWTRTRR